MNNYEKDLQEFKSKLLTIKVEFYELISLQADVKEQEFYFVTGYKDFEKLVRGYLADAKKESNKLEKEFLKKYPG